MTIECTNASHPKVEELDTDFLAGSVIFSNGTNLAEDNTNLFWDDSLNKLLLGSTLTSTALEITGNQLITASGFGANALVVNFDQTGSTTAFQFADTAVINIDYDFTGSIITNSASTESGITADVTATSAVTMDGFGLTIVGIRGFAKSSATYNSGGSNSVTALRFDASLHTTSPVVDASATLSFVGANISATGDMGTTGTTAHIGTTLSVTGTADLNTGLRITAVSGGTTNFGIIDQSGADWRLESDNQAILLGAAPGDASLLYDGTNLVIDSAIVGSGFTAIESGLRVTGNLGVFGTTPVAQAAAYTPTNVTPDRAYNANSTTVNELADVLGTLIADLQTYGLLQ